MYYFNYTMHMLSKQLLMQMTYTVHVEYVSYFLTALITNVIIWN